MKSKAFKLWLAVLFVFTGGAIISMAVRKSKDRAPDARNEIVVDTASEPLDSFVLTRRNGEKLESRSLEGQPWVASFFFTTCPSECVQQNLKVKQLVEQYASSGVKFLSITCDPKRDTPRVLADYADRFSAPADSWFFLTGRLSYIEKIGGDVFKVSVTPTTHSNKLILINRDGAVHGYFSWQDPQQMALFHRELEKMLSGKISQSTSTDASEEIEPS